VFDLKKIRFVLKDPLCPEGSALCLVAVCFRIALCLRYLLCAKGIALGKNFLVNWGSYKLQLSCLLCLG